MHFYIDRIIKSINFPENTSERKIYSFKMEHYVKKNLLRNHDYYRSCYEHLSLKKSESSHSMTKKANWPSEETLKIAVRRREAKSKGKKQRYAFECRVPKNRKER